jgi:hypothetical protein
MPAILALDEEEKYLAALMDDPSGIDLAEAFWTDDTPGRSHRRYRLWDFQYALYWNEATFQADKMARSLGKTAGIIMRACAFPLNFPGQEMLITAPELNHLSPVVDKVEEKIKAIRLLREMLPAIKGGGIRHQPQFQASFVNGSRIMGRLPQRTGVGVKGSHPLVLEQDESQDYPGPGWIELIETMKHGIPGAQWRAHGVSNGVRDTYHRITSGESAGEDDMPFYVHEYPAMYRPTWSDVERKQKISIYGGSRDNPDYKRNIYGEAGSVSDKVFVLARLMACVRINESSWATEYNESVYSCIKIEGESLEGRPIESLINLPASHLHKSYSSYWAGMDLGFTNDPSELLVFGVIRQKRGGEEVDVLRLLARIHLMRVSAVDQEKVIAKVFDFYGLRLRALSMDKSGNGLPVWQHMDKDPTHAKIRDRVKGYGFSEKKAVEFDDRPLVGKETPEDAVIEKNIIEWATDKLREFVDAGMVELPYDKELLTEFQGQVVVYSRESNGSGGRRKRYGGGSFHTLDASKVMILGKELEAIELALAPKRRGPVLDAFIG